MIVIYYTHYSIMCHNFNYFLNLWHLCECQFFFAKQKIYDIDMCVLNNSKKGAARMDDALNIDFIDCLKDLLRL